MSYVGRKSGRAALIAADIPSNLTLLGSNVKIPTVTTANLPGAVGGTNASITAVDGMLVYNSTLGMLQQRASGIWSGITTAPVITSFVYSDGASATAENPAGGGVITVTGTNFDSTAAGGSANAGLTFGGTTATSISVNAGKTVITATVPAKAAGTVTMQVINASGLTAETNFIYDTEPVFSTAEAIGSFADGVYTANASAPRIVAAEGADTITYARVTSLTDDTVISTTVAGLTLGSTGYLTGTLAGTNATTYPFYAQATDAENQNTPKLFNIISYDYAATGGTITTYAGYVVHTFTSNGTFTPISSFNVDYLVVAGGGGTGSAFTGGGGAGGLRSTVTGTGGGGSLESALSVTAQAYSVVVGDGGTGVGDIYSSGATSGGNSSFSSVTSNGGGIGGGYVLAGSSGGSGGGGGGGDTTSGGTGTTNQGYAGGTGQGPNTPYIAGGGGGGAGAVGTNGTYSSVSANSRGGAGGAGVATSISGSSVSYAGGGGGNSQGTGAGGVGGSGGGGAGGNASNINGVDGTPNTGGGGGAGGTSSGTGGAGGSGVVIIRYAV
jgi:hypothetical protein